MSSVKTFAYIFFFRNDITINFTLTIETTKDTQDASTIMELRSDVAMALNKAISAEAGSLSFDKDSLQFYDGM